MKAYRELTRAERQTEYAAIRAATLSPADDPQVQAALGVLKG